MTLYNNLPVVNHQQMEALKVITDERLSLIWPCPTYVKQLSETGVKIPNEMPLTISNNAKALSIHDILDAFDAVRTNFRMLNRKVFLNNSCPVSDYPDSSDCVVHCNMNELLHRVEGSYNLHLNEGKVKISASDLEGLRNALSTLAQIFRRE